MPHLDATLVLEYMLCDGLGLGLGKGKWSMVRIRAGIAATSRLLPLPAVVSIQKQNKNFLSPQPCH